jgi:hypothetical protein
MTTARMLAAPMLAARGFPSPTAAPRRLDFLDQVLVVIFLLGLYLGVSLAVSEKVPLTCAPSLQGPRFMSNQAPARC